MSNRTKLMLKLAKHTAGYDEHTAWKVISKPPEPIYAVEPQNMGDVNDCSSGVLDLDNWQLLGDERKSQQGSPQTIPLCEELKGGERQPQADLLPSHEDSELVVETQAGQSQKPSEPINAVEINQILNNVNDCCTVLDLDSGHLLSGDRNHQYQPGSPQVLKLCEELEGAEQHQPQRDIPQSHKNDEVELVECQAGPSKMLPNQVFHGDNSFHSLRCDDSFEDPHSEPSESDESSSISSSVDPENNKFSSSATAAEPQNNSSSDNGEPANHQTGTNNGKRKVLYPADPPEKRVRKRQARQEKWKRNVVKKKRNSGESYFSLSVMKNPDNGTKRKTIKERKARQMLAPCGEKCRLQCSTEISSEERFELFESYWNLASLQRQRDFISSCLTHVKPKYSYHRDGAKTQNPHSAYFFTVGEQKKKVCKVFFLSTLGISERVVRTVLTKRKEKSCGGILTEELRGRHGNHKKCPESVKDAVRQHINSIPKIESHYCRADTSKEYIEGGMSISQLYRDYVEDQKKKGNGYCKYLMYYEIFNTEFNIAFFTPKKDQCVMCTTYTNSNDDEKAGMMEDYEEHLREKNLSRKEKERDKQSGNIVAEYDLQAVMPCPNGDASSFYYVSKLNVFNLTIYLMKEMQATCFVWHEGEASRGSSEIGTCVWRFLETLNDRAMKSSGKNEVDVVFYSDNCAGQNKNKFICALYNYAAQVLPYVRSITHKYLVTGHTQNEGDHVHSVIEQHIKRWRKNSPIYVPDQFTALIRTAKKTGKPFIVDELCHKDFFDLKLLCEEMKMDGDFMDSNGQKVKLSQVRVLRFQKNEPNKLLFKYSYGDELFNIATTNQFFGNNNMNTRRRSKQPTTQATTVIERVLLKNAYSNKKGISKAKKDGLLSLFPKRLIPATYLQFYQNL